VAFTTAIHTPPNHLTKNSKLPQELPKPQIGILDYTIVRRNVL
jgi:hypothetical protein